MANKIDVDKQQFTSEMNSLKEKVPGLPYNPYRALEAYGTGMETNQMFKEAASKDIAGISASLGSPVTPETYDREAMRIKAQNQALTSLMAPSRNPQGFSKSGSMRRTSQDGRWNQGFTPKTSMLGGGGSAMGGDVYNAIPRFYDPLEYWDISGLPWNVADEGHRHKLHKWLRLYYATHYLVPILVDIFTRFPLVGMEIESPDSALTAIYEDLFLDQLKYEDFLVALGREFWLVGEAFPLGSFDEDLGIWEHEELINPEDVVIDNFPLLDSQQLKIVPPDYLRRIAQTKSPAREWYMLQQNYEDLIPYLLKGEHIPISPVMLTQVANKLNNWDDHGTPILLRGLRTLLHEEKLLASQDAIAERLYSPFILAKLGIMDMGDGLPPWIPTPDELNAVRDDIDIAMASDFRVMVHHFGLEMSSVFGREQMPRLGDDFDRIERRLMECLGGDTLVHTIEGLKPIKELAGRNVSVLSDGGIFRNAQWSSHGERRIYELHLENGDVIEATKGHQWIVNTKNGRKKRFSTTEMVGKRIPLQFAQNDFKYDEEEWLIGARHGLVYGDGWQYLSGRYTMVRQYDPNKLHLIPDLFDNHTIHKIKNGVGYATAATSLPGHWKQLPSIEESPSYLRGFIAGLIAADGSVDDTGHVEIAQANYAELQKIRKLAQKAQIGTIEIQETTANCFKHSNLKRPADSQYFELSFMKSSFWLSNNKGYDSKLILASNHRKLAEKCAKSRQRYSILVIDVVRTDRFEEVFCCEESETHSFVIENMYLTGNCFGVNPSLLSAGSNSQPYASSALQAEFMNQILHTFQKTLKDHFKFRASVVAEAQEHWAYEKKGQSRVPIFENVVSYDEDGNKIITREHKLLIPSIEFATFDLRDEATERQFLMGLREAGLPIPDDKLMIGISWSDKDYIDEYNRDIMKKTIAQQRAKMDTYIALVIQGLPVPMDLKYEVESVLQGGTGPEMGGAPGDPGAGGPGGGMGGPPPGGGEDPGGPPPGGGSGFGAQMPSPPGGLGPGPGMQPPGGGAPPMAPGGLSGGGTNAPQVSNERRPGLTYNTSVDEVHIAEWPEEMQSRAKVIKSSIDKYGWFYEEPEEPKISAILDNEDPNDPETWILRANQKIAEHNGENVIIESNKKRINLINEQQKKYSIIDSMYDGKYDKLRDSESQSIDEKQESESAG